MKSQITTILFFVFIGLGCELGYSQYSPARDPLITQIANTHADKEIRTAIAEALQSKFDRSIPKIKDAAKQGDLAAKLILAKFHENGFGIEKSLAQSAKLLEENVSANHPASFYALAEQLEKSAPNRSLDLYMKSADSNEPLAFLKLGSLAENGNLGLRTNPKMAVSYYEKAARTGSPAGNFQLARCYASGIGVSVDQLKSTRLYRKAALGGVGIANTIMARRYLLGQGVEQDAIAAVGWLTRGQQAGDSEAMVLLGERYEKGDSVGRDLNQAGQLYSRAAKLGDKSGIYRLALMYLNGIGTPSDPIRAYVLLNNAQELPAAKKLFDNLNKQMPPEQLKLARQKLAESIASQK